MESTTNNVKYYEMWRDIMGPRPVLPPDKVVKINKEEDVKEVKEDYTTTIIKPTTKEDPEYFDLNYDDVTNANIVFDKILLPIAVSSVKLSPVRLADSQFSKYIKYLEKFRVIIVPVFNTTQLLENGNLGQSFISSSYHAVDTIINELGLSSKIEVVPFFVGEVEPRGVVSHLQSEVAGNDVLVLNLTAIRRFYRIAARLGKLGIYGDMSLLTQINTILFSSSYTNMTPRQYMTDRIQMITELFDTILDKYYTLKDGDKVVDILRTVIMRLIDYVYMNAAYIDSMGPERYKKELLSKKKKFNTTARKFIANVKRYIGSLDPHNETFREEILTRLSDAETKMFESIVIPDNGVTMRPLTRVLDSWTMKKSNRRTVGSKEVSYSDGQYRYLVAEVDKEEYDEYMAPDRPIANLHMMNRSGEDRIVHVIDYHEVDQKIYDDTYPFIPDEN